MLRVVLIVAALVWGAAAQAQTSWDPAHCPLTLSPDKLSVTGKGPAGPWGCRSTSAKGSGLVYWQVRVDNFNTYNWQTGLADGSWSLTTNNSPNGAYIYAAPGDILTLNVGATTLCANLGAVILGTTIEIAADLAHRRIDARRLGDATWCVSQTTQPSQGIGTGPLAGATPWYIAFYGSDTNNTATQLLGVGSLPAGYAYWDLPPEPPRDLVAVTNAQRYAGNPIMTHDDFIWSANGQLCCTTILDDPTDSRKIVMYIVAWTPDPFCCGTPVRLEGLRSNPYSSWNLSSTADKVVDGVTLGRAIQVMTMDQPWEQFIWVGSIFNIGPNPGHGLTPNTYWMYYSGNQTGTGVNGLGVATSTDGKGWTKHPGNPILRPAGNEELIGNPFVWYENGAFTMIFSYRIPGRILPGYKCAVSSDGIIFSRDCPSQNPGSDIYSCPNTPALIHCEVVGIIKVRDVYLLYSEQGTWTRRYRHEIAQSETGLVTGPYRNLATSPMFRGSIDQDGTYGTWDQFHVATAFLYHSTPPGPDSWILYYQGGGQYDMPGSPLNPPGFESNSYEHNNWKIGAADIDLTYLGSGEGGVALLPAGIGRSSMGLRR